MDANRTKMDGDGRMDGKMDGKRARLVRRRFNAFHFGVTELWDVGDGHGIIVDYCPCTLTTGEPDTVAFPIDLARYIVTEPRRWPCDATCGKAIRDLGYEPIEED